jgi:hypothetical protein
VCDRWKRWRWLNNSTQLIRFVCWWGLCFAVFFPCLTMITLAIIVAQLLVIVIQARKQSSDAASLSSAFLPIRQLSRPPTLATFWSCHRIVVCISGFPFLIPLNKHGAHGCDSRDACPCVHFVFESCQGWNFTISLALKEHAVLGDQAN